MSHTHKFKSATPYSVWFNDIYNEGFKEGGNKVTEFNRSRGIRRKRMYVPPWVKAGSLFQALDGAVNQFLRRGLHCAPRDV